VRDGAYVIPALPVPLAPTVRAHDADRAAPALGEASVAELGRA
jgi:hypothetical protein